MNFFNFAAEASAGNAAAAGGTVGTVSYLIIMGLIFVVFYFVLIRPQKKKEKEAAKMRDNLEIGDEIVTIGGIIGRVVSIKEDHIVIETASDRSKIRIKKWAIQSNETIHDN